MTHMPEEFVSCFIQFLFTCPYLLTGIPELVTMAQKVWRDQHGCNAFCKHLELEVGDSGDEGGDE
jgi:hypothetical protein